MARPDLRIGESSREALQPYRDLPLKDPRRRILFSFLVNAVEDPNAVQFEEDEDGIRYTYLPGLAVLWEVDAAAREIEILAIRDL